jgi:hypothetical protein
LSFQTSGPGAVLDRFLLVFGVALERQPGSGQRSDPIARWRRPSFVSGGTVKSSGCRRRDPTIPVRENRLGALIGQIIPRLNDEDLEHHRYRIKWRTRLARRPNRQASRSARGDISRNPRPPGSFRAVAEIAQPPQSIAAIKKSRLPSHSILFPIIRHHGRRTTKTWRGFLDPPALAGRGASEGPDVRM